MKNELNERISATAKKETQREYDAEQEEAFQNGYAAAWAPGIFQQKASKRAVGYLEEYYLFRINKAKKHMADNGVIYIEDSEEELYDQWERERNG